MEFLDNSPLDAMIREFKEETGAEIKDWNYFTKMRGEGWTVYCYRAIGNVDLCQTVTDEEVKIINVSNLHYEKVLPNLKWLIPLAMAGEEIEAPVFQYLVK